MRHNELNQIIHNGFGELLLTHLIVGSLGKIGLLFGLADVVEVLHARGEVWPDFDSHGDEFLNFGLEVHFALHC